jgi:Na+/melibiose symporter-like transporter
MLKPVQIAAFVSMSIPLTILSLPIIIYVGPYYGDELGLGLAKVGTIFLIVRTFDALFDIFVGRLSDLTDFPLGRRKTWVAFGTPFLILASWLVSFPPPAPSPLYFAAAVTLYYVAWTIVQIPHLSWGQDLGKDAHARRSMSAWRETGSVIGALLAGGLPLIVAQGDDPSTAGHAIRVLGIASITLLALAGVLVTFLVPDPRQREGTRPSSRGLLALFNDGSFVTALLALFIINWATGAYNGAVFLLVEKELGMESRFLPMVLAQYIICLAALPFTVSISQRIGLAGTIKLGIGIFIGGLIVAAILPAGIANVITLAISAGLYVSTYLVLPPALIAEFSVRRMAKDGTDRMAEHLALYNLVTKFGAAVGASVALMSMDWLRDNLTASQDSLYSAARVAGAYVPALLFLLSMPILRKAVQPIRDKSRSQSSPLNAEGECGP